MILLPPNIVLRADDVLVSLERRVQILAISNYFEPQAHEPSLPRPSQESHIWSTGDMQAHQLMFSPQDLSSLIHTLYPVNPIPEKPAVSLTAVQSSAPASTTSSSTLRPGSSDVGSRASSMGPNYSGSSVNSEATITGNAAASPHGMIDSLSHGLSSNRPTGTEEASSDADPDKVAWQLWALYAKLQAVTKTESSPSSGAVSTYRWAIFPVHCSGRVSLKPSVLWSEMFTSEESANQSDKRASNLRALRKAIVTLLAEQDRGQVEEYSRNQPLSEGDDPLRTMLEDALAGARLSMQFGTAHHWYQCLQIYSDLAKSSDGESAIHSLQNSIKVELQLSLDRNIKHAQASDTLIRSLSFLEKGQKTFLATLEGRRIALRIKMWYLSDVKHSSTYEDALLVTKALRAMTAPKRNKQPGSTFSWARQRLRGQLSQERADAQTLEAMTASKGCGGRSKLAGEQVEMTSRWLTRTGIENLCCGEERIHRFCHEIQKAVGKLTGASLLDSPVLWSSHLFRRERAAWDTRSPQNGLVPSPGLSNSSAHSHGAHWRSLTTTPDSLPPMTSPVSVSAHTRGLGDPRVIHSQGEGARIYPSVSPAPRSTLSALQNTQGMNGNVIMPRLRPRYDHEDVTEQILSKKNAMAKDVYLRTIKDALYGLLASDLGYLLWDQGSETDAWINRAAAEEQVDDKSTRDTLRSSLEVQTGEPQHINVHEDSVMAAGRGVRRPEQSRAGAQSQDSDFGFTDAYQTLLCRMSTTCDPLIKLEMLSQLEHLVVLSIQDTSTASSGSGAPTQDHNVQLQSEAMSRSKSVPRTKTTSLEEVVANCTERRAATLRATPSLNDMVSTDAIVNHLLTIFRDPHLRPANLFLSLQYIAAFIPAYTLDHTAHGKAFWDCALAALALKEELCNSTVRRAAEITNAYITSKPISPPYPPQQEAANLWLIAAKEGSPVAARELGLFYLTHPDLLPQRITMPLSRPKDVFKSLKTSDVDGSSGGGGNISSGLAGQRERGTLDPLTFDVVHHWMEIAANGGDEVARTFLRQGGGHP